MTAAETYAARIDAVRAQRARLHGAPPPDDPWAGPVARCFRADPHRPLDANLAVLASYTRPEDVLLDVGGGAGRVALPLALRCREVITVDASPGMGAEFTAPAGDAHRLERSQSQPERAALPPGLRGRARSHAGPL